MNWETALLGSILAEPEAMREVEHIRPDDFTGSNKILWGEMIALHRRNSLELPAVYAALGDRIDTVGNGEVVGEAYLRYLLSYRGTAVQEYADRVLSASMRRQLEKVAALILADAQDERISVQDAFDKAEERLIRVRRTNLIDDAVPLGDILTSYQRRVDGFRSGEIAPAWVPHIDALRRLIGFVDWDDYILIAARPGEGKSSIMRYDFIMSALQGVPVAILNMENGELEYAKFAIAMVSGIDSDRLKDARSLTEGELNAVRQAAEVLANAPLYIKTIGSPSAADVKRISLNLIIKHDIKRLGVDYIQLVSNGNENRVVDVSITSGVLRSIALNSRIPVVANSQMSREIVRRGTGAEPQLSDLRDSGSLEQDSTMVWFPRAAWGDNPTDTQISRFPENMVVNDVRQAIRAMPIKIFVRKNRNGAVGVTEEILWRKHLNLFGTLTNREED